MTPTGSTGTWRHDGYCPVVRTVEHRLQQQQQPPQLLKLTQLLLCSSNPSSAAKPELVLRDRAVVPITTLSKKVPPIHVRGDVVWDGRGQQWRQQQRQQQGSEPIDYQCTAATLQVAVAATYALLLLILFPLLSSR